ncbi:energy-coupled thiamine transporter ThiT [Spiroplasma endosymbiont of Panorpa germanica]|uniref:energy-coupled thiamine transporter ThiT n=1 Tax=Spiroplasma endosymbiont of Panorpa germanica TaxID=3066314 RepID=UPI0030D09D3A
MSVLGNKKLPIKKNFDAFYKIKYFSLTNFVISAIISLIVEVLAIVATVFLVLKIQESLKIENNNFSGRISLIIITAFLINVFVLLNQSLKLLLLFTYQHSFKGQLLFFGIFTIDFYTFTMVLMKDKKTIPFFSFKPEKWIIFDYVFIALCFALYFALGFVSSLVPQLPFFITITIKFIPLFFLAFICDWTKVLVCSVICGGFEWFFPGTFIINVPQFIFDYWVPPIGITFAALIKPSRNDSNSFRKLDFILFISAPILWIYFSRVIAGVMFWSTFPWPGFNAWTYSLVFNSINTIVDYVVFLIVVPLICSNLSLFKDKYKSITYK